MCYPANVFQRGFLALFLLNIFVPVNAQGLLEEVVVTATKRETECPGCRRVGDCYQWSPVS